MSITKCNSARNFLITPGCLVDTAVQDFKEARLGDFSIQPMCGTVVVAAVILVYAMASQHTGQVYLIGPGRKIISGHLDGFCQTEYHKGMQIGEADLQKEVPVAGHDRSFILRHDLQHIADHLSGAHDDVFPAKHFFVAQFTLLQVHSFFHRVYFGMVT